MDIQTIATVASWLFGAAKWQAPFAGGAGRKLLRDFVAALDAMPEKRLGAGALKDEDSCMCSLGVVAEARKLDMADVDFGECDYEYGPSIDHKAFADRFDVASQLTKEIMFMNDEGGWYGNETPEQRWSRMRQWAADHLKETP